MVRVLRSRDIEGNISFLEIVDAVEAGYRAAGDGGLVARPRSYLTAPGTHTTLSVSPAVSAELGVGVFAFTGGNKGKGLPQKLAIVFDPTDGGLAYLIESDWLSWARTGASSAVGSRHLVRPDASVVGIVGAGKQARSQLLAIAAARPIERALVVSPRRARCGGSPRRAGSGSGSISGRANRAGGPRRIGLSVYVCIQWARPNRPRRVGHGGSSTVGGRDAE